MIYDENDYRDDDVVDDIDYNYYSLLFFLFLCQKLSVVGENKDAIKQLSTPLDQLIKFVACSSQPLVTITLRLLFNMSFDKVRKKQV